MRPSSAALSSLAFESAVNHSSLVNRSGGFPQSSLTTVPARLLSKEQKERAVAESSVYRRVHRKRRLGQTLMPSLFVGMLDSSDGLPNRPVEAFHLSIAVRRVGSSPPLDDAKEIANGVVQRVVEL